MRKSFIILGIVMALLLAFAMPALGIKIAPYSQPLHDIMHWDAASQRLIINNPEGESQTISWPSTVDLWNYNGNSWTFDLPTGDKFAFSKRVDVNVSSAAVAGTINSVVITQTMTVASNVNMVEALKVVVSSDIKTGAWAQAIFAQMDYVTNGLAHGVGSVICAELSLPASSVVRGTYYVWQSEIDVPTGCVMNANPIAVMSISVWGGAKTQFDDVGYFLDISGVISGAADFFYDSTVGVVDGFLKCRINGATYYILLADDQT